MNHTLPCQVVDTMLCERLSDITPSLFGASSILFIFRCDNFLLNFLLFYILLQKQVSDCRNPISLTAYVFVKYVAFKDTSHTFHQVILVLK